jgi:hypothetical protein
MCIPWRVPVVVLADWIRSHGQQTFLLDTWETRLVESHDFEVLAAVFLNDSFSLDVSVE